MAFLILALVFILVMLAFCGFAAWGTTNAMTGLTLATGNLVNQVTIAVLAIGIVAIVALMVYVAVQAFNLGRAVEGRRAAEDIGDLQHQLEVTRARQAQLPAQGAVLLLPPGSVQPAIRAQRVSLGDRQHEHEVRKVRRVSRRAAARVALRTAKRWFQ